MTREASLDTFDLLQAYVAAPEGKRLSAWADFEAAVLAMGLTATDAQDLAAGFAPALA